MRRCGNWPSPAEEKGRSRTRETKAKEIQITKRAEKRKETKGEIPEAKGRGRRNRQDRQDRQNQLREALLSILFPRRCPVCGEIVMPKGEKICPDCRKTLPFVSGPRCLRCGKELETREGEYCLGCQRHKRSFVFGGALLNYNEVSARSMAKIKYQNRREYLDYYSEEMVRRLGRLMSRMEAEVFVPVPVHPARRRQRGYNQAEELAMRLGKLTGLPVCADALVRTKKTAPQKELSAGERLKNLEKAFAARPEFLPPGTKGVILVDDIYTTGSTVEACARVLRGAGVKRVYFLSICIGGDR